MVIYYAIVSAVSHRSFFLSQKSEISEKNKRTSCLSSKMLLINSANRLPFAPLAIDAAIWNSTCYSPTPHHRSVQFFGDLCALTETPVAVRVVPLVGWELQTVRRRVIVGERVDCCSKKTTAQTHSILTDFRFCAATGSVSLRPLLTEHQQLQHGHPHVAVCMVLLVGWLSETATRSEAEKRSWRGADRTMACRSLLFRFLSCHRWLISHPFTDRANSSGTAPPTESR